MKLYSLEEMNYLKEFYPDLPTSEIAMRLNRTITSVHQKAHEMGLKKSESFIEKEKNRIKALGEQFRYTKGNVPANKGKKMSKETYEKCSKTFFEKGSKPHNTKKENSTELRGDGYLYSKIKDGVWELTHRLEWIKHNGEIPYGYIVVFKDKNRMNVAIDNLECISLQENMKRNSIQRYPLEVQDCMKLLSKLNKKISNYGKK